MKLFLNGFSNNKIFSRFSQEFINAMMMMMREIANLLSSALDSLAVLHREEQGRNSGWEASRRVLREGRKPARRELRVSFLRIF
jgi:hypothetical protein